MPWPQRGEAVDEGEKVPGHRAHRLAGQGQAGPPEHRVGQHRARFVEEDQPVAAAPGGHRAVPRLARQRGQLADRVRGPERQEQLPPGAVRGAVEGLDPAAPEQGVEDRAGKGAVAVHVALVVEEPHGVGAAHGQRRAPHDPGGTTRSGLRRIRSGSQA
ncbi:hypothetical protein [Streptomyces sp. C8S0]|uniref:hypothetical protein n=1 Tax=Streptomyces sp. C8S0 TaxID=2585716 RepID=UPI00299F7EEF|nr:hypothetical protein [Streptomyces sp. C8S0]